MIKELYSQQSATIIALALLACIGCGPTQKVDPNRAVVPGTVTFDGKPLPAGQVSFSSTEAPRSTSILIREGGRYSTDRVPIGPNVVTIETESVQSGSPHLYVKIPAKYADPAQSGLTIDVKPGDNENVNFELKSAP
jgi:hypothetical protein